MEDVVREGFLLRAGVVPWEADSLRRFPPIHRDLFDNFLFSATRFAVGEGDWSTFPHACRRYLSATSGELQRPPPLIPPAVADTVAEVLSRFRQRETGEKFVAGIAGRVTAHEQQLAEQLFFALGDDRGDGLSAAGLRVYSKMMSARISDGFVHPAVGAHIWGDVPAGPPHLPSGGPHIRILRTIEALSRQWVTSPADRPKIERMIIDRAHTLGWRTESPGLVEGSPGQWEATPPPGNR
ncbi:hypothetical protein BFL43_00990 [Williamsia sp. 1135]|nr:hypothetical protein BFL43_00990 [Williamsia sp. 1135]